MSELNVTGLDKFFGPQQVLHGVDLTVAPGTLAALLGPSGSGKTTLLRLVCGFERVDGGTIRIGGDLVSSKNLHVPSEKRQIGYVAQDGALFPHLSVADNITFGLPRSARKQRRRVGELLELVGLPQSYADRPPQELSGGEQQRVSLARALAPKPGLVLLDEPFSSLDAGLRVETRQAVAAALVHSNATALLVTHDQAEALSLGHQVSVLLKGRLVQTAAPDVLYRRPVDVAVARFIGDAILMPGTAAGGIVNCPLGRVPLASGMPEGAVEVMIRPEQIRLVPREESATRATVLDVTYYGHDATVRLALPGLGDEADIIARIPGFTRPETGSETGIMVDGRAVTYARA
jgi:iron(III) transport system ATP-binding protein